jgi:hypothetical protein
MGGITTSQLATVNTIRVEKVNYGTAIGRLNPGKFRRLPGCFDDLSAGKAA